uniref:hypothetical protein n=1 Tax=Altererythrobacter segetis TaxID=1104773 RepID=UPI00140D80BE|nr:hypothetical protein [Altererythrobacter segetis]
MMTGSRAGTALISVAVVFVLAILEVSRAPGQRLRGLLFVLVTAAALLAGLAVVTLASAENTALSRVAERFEVVRAVRRC